MYLKIESGISFDGNDQSHSFSDLHESVGCGRERASSNLDVQLSSRRVTAERHYFLSQHVYGEVHRQRFVDVPFPEATDSPYRIPDLLYSWFVLKKVKRSLLSTKRYSSVTSTCTMLCVSTDAYLQYQNVFQVRLSSLPLEVIDELSTARV